MKPLKKTAAIVTIGDELLAGKTIDQNTGFLITHLSQQGIIVRCAVTIPDDIDLIVESVKTLSARVNWTFVSGGLGPTHDDMTIEAIAKAFEAPLVTNQILVGKIRKMFGESCTEGHLKMANVPEGTVLIELAHQKIPIIQFRNIFVFPGVPELMNHLFLQIKDRFIGEILPEVELLLKADEGVIAEDLKQTIVNFPGIKIGSYPSILRGGFSIKLILQHKNKETLEKAVLYLKNRVGVFYFKA